MRRKNIHEQVVDKLGKQIALGDYPPDAKLPTELHLAETLGVSRLLVREAIKSLAARGMVTVRPRTGTRVLPRESWQLLDRQVLEWQAAGDMNSEVLDDLIEFRLMIEPQAARLACQNARPEDIVDLHARYQEMAEAAYGADYIEADLRFHSALLTACHNLIVMQFEAAMDALFRTSFMASTLDPATRPDALRLHLELVTAIERRDSNQAERIARRIISNAGALIKKNATRPAQPGVQETAGPSGCP